MANSRLAEVFLEESVSIWGTAVLSIEEVHKARDYLTAIFGSLDLLQRHALDDHEQRHIQRAYLAAERLAKLIEFPQSIH